MSKMKKTTVGAVLAAYERGEVKMSAAEVNGFRSLPKSTPVYFEFTIDSVAPTAKYADEQGPS